MQTYKTSLFSLIILSVFFLNVVLSRKSCTSIKKSTSKLICYYSNLDKIIHNNNNNNNYCYCTHIILPSTADVKTIEKLRNDADGVKIYVTANEFNQNLIHVLNNTKIDGIEINLKKITTKNDISDFISTIKTKIASDLDIAISVPVRADAVAKYFDFKVLSKHADLFILQTAFIYASSNVTFHPSRLSGMWDMQNTDSVVDLIGGLGAPLSKVVISVPVQAYEFTLQDEEYTALGSPALELKSITRNELCQLMMSSGTGKNWTLERDEDLAGPYIFSGNKWIALEDSKSIDIKVKYSRVRGLAGIALKDLSQDNGSKKCGASILESTYTGLSKQARVPRGAVLHSLEREIVENPSFTLDQSVQNSPYRISRIIDTEGKIHVVKKDSRTEFQCSRQGYFVHPRSCNRFYRCVKFNQQTEDFNVFEFDCPAGLAFDERVEVCVWPGSLPHGTPCSGSSEIAPVPKQRFVCPSEPGYYADPENCRWFFACLDHGKSPLSAYEFRCPFGLVFDGNRLVCEWPWLVPRCANGFGENGLESEYYNGGSAYAAQGYASPGVVLQNYDGLGPLYNAKLGGVSGTIQRPLATVYSNVGGAASGLGYKNDGGYILNDGLSYNAIQSLQNAGLLKVNQGVGYSVDQQNQAYSYNGEKVAIGNLGYSLNANHLVESNAANIQNNELQGVAFNQGSTGHLEQGAYQGNRIEVKNIAAGGFQQYFNQGAAQQNNAFSSQSITQHHGQVQSAEAANHLLQSNNLNGVEYKQASPYVSTGYVLNQANTNTDGYLNYENGGQANYVQVVSGQNVNQNIENENQQIYSNINNVKTSYQDGIAGNVNIIGKGYSAVGIVSDIHVSNNGENNDVKTVSFSSTPRPLTVAFAPAVDAPSIPTVTSVPVPGIKTAVGFETIKGGVIANAPEYQTRVKYHGDVGLLNISTGFANYVVNTPVAQQSYSQSGNYAYNSGVVNSVDSHGVVPVQISSARPFIPVTTEQPNVYISSTERPVFISEQKQPTVTVQQVPVSYSTVKPEIGYVKSVVSSIAHNQLNTDEAYKYENEQHIQQNAYTSFSTPRPAILIENQPKVYVSSTPATPVAPVVQDQAVYQVPKSHLVVNQQPAQPAVVNQYYYQSEHQQQPVQYYQPVSTYKYKNIAQTAVGVNTNQRQYSYQVNDNANYQNIHSSIGQQAVQETAGYSYPKPAVTFEESSLTSKPIISVQPVQPAVVTTYVNTESSTTKPLVPIGSTTPEPNLVVHQQVGYSYPKPRINFEQLPLTSKTVIPLQINYYNIESQTVRPVISTPRPEVIVQKQQNVGYVYPKPVVKFEETHSIVNQPVQVQQVVPAQPAIVTSYFNIGSSTVKPEVHSYEQGQNVDYSKSSVNVDTNSIVYSTHRPTINSAVNLDNSQNNYAYSGETYSTVRPAISNSYYAIGTSTEKPIERQNIGYQYPQPNIVFEEAPVTNYNITSKSQQNIGYIYSKPAIHFEETPKVYQNPRPTVNVVSEQPALVNSYFNIGPALIKPKEIVQEQVSNVVGVQYNNVPVTYSTTPTTTHVVINEPHQQPAVVSSYFNIGSSTAKPILKENVGYKYPQPEVKFQEVPVVHSTPKPFVPVQVTTPAVVNSYFYQQQPNKKIDGYDYPKPSVQFVEEPQPILTTNYVNKEPVNEIPFVKKTTYVTGQNEGEYNAQINLHQSKGVVVENYEFPQYEQVKQVIFGEKLLKQNADSQEQLLNTYHSTVRPTFLATVAPKNLHPVTPAYVTSYDSRYSSTPVNYVPTSTVAPSINTVSTTSRPISKFAFTSLEDQHQYLDLVKLTTVESTRAYLPVTTSAPKITNAPLEVTRTTFVVPKVTTPSNEYLPARSKTKIPSKQYIPVEVTAPSVEYLPIKVTTIAPKITTLSRDYLPIKSRIRLTTTTVAPQKEENLLLINSTPRAPIQTVIKQNDAHPLLSAKLGAQCVCVSNTLKLRKKQKIIVAEENIDDDEDDDGYIVDDGSYGKVVEDYKASIAEVTSERYLPSTVSVPVQLHSRKRIKVRPVVAESYSPAPEISELLIKNVPTVTDSPVSDKDIIHAVRTGLKLVKQAAKEGAKEGTAAVLSRQLDRYGHGGVRSRSETLQGTIDCQRAGLFRHPSECNKFYTCRWDCTKNRFTLHIFNCPVHLTFDNNLGACNWPSQGPACIENTLIVSD